MQHKAYNVSRKFTASAFFVAIFCLFCQLAAGQEYTANDSASFQHALTKDLSGFDRISYQLKLAEYSIRKPGSFKTDLDNARMWIDRSKQLNSRLKSKEAEGYILFEEVYLDQENGPSPKGKAMCQAAINLLKTGDDKYLLASAYAELAYYYSTRTTVELQEKIKLIKQAATLFEQCGNKMKAAGTLQYLADLYQTVPDYPSSINAIHQSLAIYNAIRYPKLQGLYDLLGTIYCMQDDYTNGVKNLLTALKISEQMRDSSSQACEINNHVALAMLKLQQLAKAIIYFKKAKIIAKKNNDVNAEFIVSANTVVCYNKLNQPAAALTELEGIKEFYKTPPVENLVYINGMYVITFTHLKQFSNARIYAERLLSLAKTPALLPSTLNNIYGPLISYYYSTKNYSRELVCLIKNQQILDKWNIASRKADNLESWYKMDSARNDFKNAFLHLYLFKKLTDSVFNEKKSRQIGQLQVVYETQKKEDEIKLKSKDIKILTQNAKINQAQLKGAQLSRNVTFAGIMIFVLITGMQYRRYREKQKLNLLITDKNVTLQKLVKEKEWLLKEVHHRVKNNLHTVICLLESQAAYLENDALKAVENSRHRIYAMSLIHQKLYQSDDIKVVNMHQYLSEFVRYLEESFGSPDHIRVKLHAENIELGAAQAIPVGLIINEAVNNSFKYAFPQQQSGEIKIQLIKIAEEIFLSVADNGIGFKQQTGLESNSLGLELINGLTVDLRGTLKLNTDHGTNIKICFMYDGIVMAADAEYGITQIA